MWALYTYNEIGLRGKVIGFDEEGGRYDVRMADDGAVKRVKPSNMVASSPGGERFDRKQYSGPAAAPTASPGPRLSFPRASPPGYGERVRAHSDYLVQQLYVCKVGFYILVVPLYLRLNLIRIVFTVNVRML